MVIVEFDAPQLLPKTDYTIWFIVGGLILIVVIVSVTITLIQNRRKVIALTAPEIPEPSKFSYVGKLNIYVTKTTTDKDIPPLSFNLFRLSSGRAVCLQGVLEDLGVKEVFGGAQKIFFKPGSNRGLILNNQSDCTIIKNREILMKNKSYELSLDSKVDISFEDEKSELTFQYKDVKLSNITI